MIYHQEDLIFQMVSASVIYHKKGKFSVKARPYAAFALRLNGNVNFQIGERSFTSHPGDITFIPDGVAYEADYSDGESMVLHLANCNYRVSENISMGMESYLKTRFEEMLGAYAKHQTHQTKSLFYHLLQVLKEREKEKSEPDRAFTACLHYMESHYKDPALSLAAIAEAGFISEATLRRKCVKHLSLSPKEYVIKLRLAHGVALLCGGVSVREAARECGFSDEKFFSRTVKAHYGVPPSAFRFT